MWIMRLAILAFTLLGAAPVHAAFTAAEAQQVDKIRTDVVTRLTLALSSMAFGIRNQEDTLAMRKLAIIQTTRATREAMTALALLVDVVSPFHFTQPNPATRAQRVADVWEHIDVAAFRIDQARAALAHATGANLRTASGFHLAAARTAIGQLNRNLAYTDARPVSYPALIGPHGDYDQTQAELARAFAYILDALEFSMQEYGVAPLTEANWYSIVQSSRIIFEQHGRGLAIMAGVGETNLSQFWRVLNYTKVLTDIRSGGMTGWYFAVLAALASNPGPRLSFAITRVGDSWRHMDQAVWSMLVFLNCSQSHDPQGCAAGQVSS
jgi:hypothetical protein